MRIPKPWVPVIARDIVKTLADRGLTDLHADPETVLKAVQELVLDELLVEDRLNQEVRELLKAHETHIERNRLDYRQLFDLTKRKLAQERNLIL